MNDVVGCRAVVAVQGLALGEALARGLERLGAKVARLPSGDDWNAAMDAAVRDLGGLDLVVHAAAPRSRDALGGDRCAVARAVAAGHQPGAVLRRCAACRPPGGALRAGGGTIVVLGPTAALVGAPGLVPLLTLAEAQRTLVKSAARQWGGHGIRLHWLGLAAPHYSEALSEARIPPVPELGPPPPALGRVPDVETDAAELIALLAGAGARRPHRGDDQSRRRRLDGPMTARTANPSRGRACWPAASRWSPARAAASAAASRWHSPPRAPAWWSPAAAGRPATRPSPASRPKAAPRSPSRPMSAMPRRCSARCRRPSIASAGSTSSCRTRMPAATRRGRSRIEDIVEEDLLRQARVAWDGSFHCAQAALPHLKASGHGRFIVLGSSFGLHGAAMNPIYSALKGGDRGFVKSLAREWGPHGITVNAIEPSAATEPTEVFFAQNPAVRDMYLKMFPLGRMGVAAPRHRPRGRGLVQRLDGLRDRAEHPGRRRPVHRIVRSTT